MSIYKREDYNIYTPGTKVYVQCSIKSCTIGQNNSITYSIEANNHIVDNYRQDEILNYNRILMNAPIEVLIDVINERIKGLNLPYPTDCSDIRGNDDE